MATRPMLLSLSVFSSAPETPVDWVGVLFDVVAAWDVLIA
jgi:hypothetical protein